MYLDIFELHLLSVILETTVDPSWLIPLGRSLGRSLSVDPSVDPSFHIFLPKRRNFKLSYKIKKFKINSDDYIL